MQGTNHLKSRPLIRPRFAITAVTLLAVYLGCPFRLNVVQGDSMEPTIRNGSLCVLDRTYYANHPLQPGEIITFRQGDENMTKRVYGAPGQTLRLVRYE